MTANKTAGSWTISWDRFKHLVKQDLAIEYVENGDFSTVREIRFGRMLPGNIMVPSVYEKDSGQVVERLHVNGAHNQVLRLLGNSVRIVPEQVHGVHPGLELLFCWRAPVPASVLKGCNYRKGENNE